MGWENTTYVPMNSNELARVKEDGLDNLIDEFVIDIVRSPDM